MIETNLAKSSFVVAWHIEKIKVIDGRHGLLNMTSGITWIPELKDQLNSGQCLLKIGPDHVQKSGGRFSENYY